MGSAESSESRRVTFGMDEEERVRVLQGIRLSDHVVKRMKDPNQPSKVEQPAPPPRMTPAPPVFDSLQGKAKAPEKESKPPSSENSKVQQPSGGKEDLLRRYQQVQAIIQDEIVQLAKREREVAAKHLNMAPQQEGSSSDQEKSSAQLARELESREADLQRRDFFCKEQLRRIEKKNAEMYKMSSEQFHEAASKLESTIKPRPTEPVCAGLQAQILRCYRENLQEVLLCSDLVRAYQRCVSAAHKAIYDYGGRHCIKQVQHA
ncbi:PREDICTED: coiled-coil-helix-coiled-coil-helix domain-containing protein 6, mitochondrial [Elephantulus edwardii]|uniref:coiled-coil-helix-coiled-coil-helix domain-containing protein 6, mitochondrial n=1 Tax=Elephantulus edwardii TaxID=28737 RepID=UPI0003F0C933|nr:PREDICTED: coiled-coil-helix-coiled-coil-helix domain-containing protein 6, mitochondrial [Elephantulus edwardii]